MTDEKHLLVLAAMGADRPGIVASVTRFLNERGCNVEDSRMAALGGEFAVMVLVSGSAEALSRVQADAAALESQELSVRIKPTRRSSPAAGVPYVVQAYCLDHEGVVHAIAATLARRGVNITSLDTSTYPAPMSGAPLFRMQLRMTVPHNVLIRQLRSDLDAVADEENIDIVLQPA